ncbi:MAG TPA: RNA 2',3'-cyclic phosphodiesterase [Gemmatimonadales bacterium]|nr:RNA 2',3'-cyclic phosphodiesterase [Gemmatimonadales bacterium]
MRLFAALPVEGAARDELGRNLAQLRRRDWPVRWVREEGLHVTIKFFGEVGEPEGIIGLLREASAGAPVQPLAPVGLGVFPNPSRARIVWAGYQGEPSLELLVHRVERGAVALGFPVEGRPFRPHVTLGRVRDGSRLPAEAAALLEEMPLTDGFSVDRLLLLSSRTGPGGATYSEVASIPLGA